MSARAEPPFVFRALDPLRDSALVHRWVTHPRAAACWLRPNAKLVEVERACMRMAADEQHRPLLALRAGRPAFLMVTYDPAGVYEAEPGDLGMRLLPAPALVPARGLLLGAALARLFRDPAVRRVVTPELPGERSERASLLTFCTREEFLGTAAAAV
ncbi:GNAT family N-acetyltransferase [Streptomyces sp. JW3]|uniref:GNAT family N-acetyltransferase n=1 Tax=Streptomyces sp. JW3 TaxID=3456955 RepID=UPI003FA45674